MRGEAPSLIVHFAAESHVTRSEDAPEVFFHANVAGTRAVLDAAAAGRVVPGRAHVHRRGLRPVSRRPVPRGGQGPRRGARDQRLRPLEGGRRRSGACRTPTGSTSSSPGPRTASARGSTPRRRCRGGRRGPCAASGSRSGATASRCATGCSSRTPSRRFACWPSAASGVRSTTSAREAEGVPNVEIARAVARAAGRDEACVYLSHYDRPQHDRRYAVATDRITALGWRAARSLEAAVAETVDWYRGERGVVVDAHPRRGAALCRLRPRARSTESAS